MPSSQQARSQEVSDHSNTSKLGTQVDAIDNENRQINEAINILLSHLTTHVRGNVHPNFIDLPGALTP